MLRQPGSAYEIGRSATLLKIQDVSRCGSHGHRPSRRGRETQGPASGALLVKLGDGTQFAVAPAFPTNSRETPPAVGSDTFATRSCLRPPAFSELHGVRVDAKPVDPVPATNRPAKEKSAMATSSTPGPSEGKRLFEYVRARPASSGKSASAAPASQLGGPHRHRRAIENETFADASRRRPKQTS